MTFNQRRLPSTDSNVSAAERLRQLEQRLTRLEQAQPVSQVTGWGYPAGPLTYPIVPQAPFGAVAYDATTHTLWVSDGSSWRGVTLV